MKRKHLDKYSEQRVDSLTDVSHRKHYSRWLNLKKAVAKAKQHQLKQTLYIIRTKRDKYGLTAQQILADLEVNGQEIIDQLQQERDRIQEAKRLVNRILKWQLHSD